MKIKYVFSIAFILSGCANYSALEISQLSHDDLTKISARQNSDLCKAYSFNNSEAVKSEILKRKLIAPENWGNVESEIFDEQSTQCALLAMKGKGCFVSGDIKITPNGKSVSKKAYIVRCKKDNARAYFIDNEQPDELTKQGIDTIVHVLEAFSNREEHSAVSSQGKQPELVSMEQVQLLLEDGKVEKIFQPHRGYVVLTLYDGTELAFDQPKSGWISEYVRENDLMYKVEKTTTE